MAVELGAHCSEPDPRRLRDAVAHFTGGQGADAVLICAATKSDEPAQLAAQIARLKGRVIIVGDVGMGLDRRAYFDKELKLVVSRSYGPGSYDPAYEASGLC